MYLMVISIVLESTFFYVTIDPFNGGVKKSLVYGLRLIGV